MYTLAVESYGAWGPEVLRAFSQGATQLAIHGNTPKSKVVAELYGRLSLLLVRANARSILVRSYSQYPNKKMNCLCSFFCVSVCVCVCLCLCNIFLVAKKNTIHTDEVCAGLLQSAWYLDDGSIAGESSSVLRALTIILAQGPSLGFHVNLKNVNCLVLVTSHLSLCLYKHQTNLT